MGTVAIVFTSAADEIAQAQPFRPPPPPLRREVRPAYPPGRYRWRWRHGNWRWTGRRWTWVPGRWRR